MKFLKALLVVLVITFSSASCLLADNGCNTGSVVTIGPTGTYPVGGGPSNNELYNGTSYHIVTHSGDPTCGFTANVNNFTGKQCVTPKPGGYNYGNVISYTVQNISCPLDDYVYFLILISVAIAFCHIKAKYVV